MLKIHYQASFVQHFLKLSLSSCCFHVGILFILTALGIGSWYNLNFALSKRGLVVIFARLMSSHIKAINAGYVCFVIFLQWKCDHFHILLLKFITNSWIEKKGNQYCEGELSMLWEAVSNTQNSISLDIQTLWSWLKDSAAPNFFQPSSHCLDIWWNILPHVWYITYTIVQLVPRFVGA